MWPVEGVCLLERPRSNQSSDLWLFQNTQSHSTKVLIGCVQNDEEILETKAQESFLQPCECNGAAGRAASSGLRAGHPCAPRSGALCSLMIVRDAESFVSGRAIVK